MKTRIFLADDHHVVRQGMRLLLEAEPDFEVIGEAGNGVQAVEVAARLRPDILIMDVVMPDLSGIEATRQIRRRAPRTRIVILSMYDTETYVIEALQAGASAYVLKKSTAEELVYAVREVLAGNMYLSPPLNLVSLEEYALHSVEYASSDPQATLTERERQVLQMAAQGMNNPEIAEQLLLSVRTVEMHRANMLKKLNLKNQTELVMYAVRRKLVW